MSIPETARAHDQTEVIGRIVSHFSLSLLLISYIHYLVVAVGIGAVVFCCYVCWRTRAARYKYCITGSPGTTGSHNLSTASGTDHEWNCKVLRRIVYRIILALCLCTFYLLGDENREGLQPSCGVELATIRPPRVDPFARCCKTCFGSSVGPFRSCFSLYCMTDRASDPGLHFVYSVR